MTLSKNLVVDESGTLRLWGKPVVALTEIKSWVGKEYIGFVTSTEVRP